MGVTGARDAVAATAPALVARMRAVTSTPVAVGLGVSTGAQAAEVAAYADGVIVGSAFVRAVTEGTVATLATDLAQGCRGRA
jgi:tryptophan synthase alpha chain